MVVEDFRRRAYDRHRLLIGAVGEIEALQPVVGCGQAGPGLGVARRILYRLAEMLLGEPEAARPEVLFPDAEIVVGVGA